MSIRYVLSNFIFIIMRTVSEQIVIALPETFISAELVPELL
jgi:hypothetical protein